MQFWFTDIPGHPLSYGKEPGQSRTPSAGQPLRDDVSKKPKNEWIPQARKPNMKTRRVNFPQNFYSPQKPIVGRRPWNEKWQGNSILEVMFPHSDGLEPCLASMAHYPTAWTNRSFLLIVQWTYPFPTSISCFSGYSLNSVRTGVPFCEEISVGR
jgi:hypothetical protein